jgi:alpha-L-fucosidase
MKKRNLLIYLLLSVFQTLAINKEQPVTPPSPVFPIPTDRQLAWQEMEQYAFIHFTTNTFTGKEWGYGDESSEVFNPSEIDVNQWIKSVKEAGLKFGVYLSPWDRNRSDYGSPSYVEYYRNQLRELFTNYGPVFETWFDGANGGDGFYGEAKEKRKISGSTYYDWPTTLEMVRKIEPSIVFFSDAGPYIRWCGNEGGRIGKIAIGLK